LPASGIDRHVANRFLVLLQLVLVGKRASRVTTNQIGEVRGLSRVEIWDLYARRFSGRLPGLLLRFASMPLGRQMKTDEGTFFESARMLNDAFGYASYERLDGDYLEFGVFRGRSFVEAWLAMRRYGFPGCLHAFDSFKGLPSSEGGFRAGDYAASRDAFERVLRRNRVPPERVTVTEGLFEQSLSGDDPVPGRNAAVAWIDCDIYESTVPVLEYLTGKLIDGAVVIFDDWFCHHGRPDRGEQRACAEWLERNPQIKLVPYRTYHCWGQSFIVNID
jgi:O-methyltransferase